eukprot:1855953-Ditylum_brightwellii.AAC.1
MTEKAFEDGKEELFNSEHNPNEMVQRVYPETIIAMPIVSALLDSPLKEYEEFKDLSTKSKS